MTRSRPTMTRQAALVWTAAALGVAAIGTIDYLTGVEIRVYPLYYAPISLVAWHRGRRETLAAAALCALSWVTSNSLAGLHFSHRILWALNTVVQGVSFSIIGLLIATLRSALLRERGLSRVDPLTALSNSRAFYEDAVRVVARCRRAGRPVAVAYIDIDDFKTVNDTLGHQAGDEVLRAVGARLRASIRPSDLAARLGGDEFALLLPEVGPREAEATLERVRASLAAALVPGPRPVSVSIGGVTFNPVPESLEQMVQRADARMYEAKTGGKNRIRLDVAGADPDRR